MVLKHGHITLLLQYSSHLKALAIAALSDVDVSVNGLVCNGATEQHRLYNERNLKGPYCTTR